MIVYRLKASIGQSSHMILWDLATWKSSFAMVHKKVFTEYLDHENLIK